MPTETFVIERVPKAKQSMKYRIVHPKDGSPEYVHTYQPAPVRDAEAAIHARVSRLWGNRPPIVGPVELEVHYVYPWLKGTAKYKRVPLGPWSQKPTSPDLCNLSKLLLDALEGVVFVNDGQVWHENNYKWHGDGRGVVEVKVTWETEEERCARQRWVRGGCPRRAGVNCNGK